MRGRRSWVLGAVLLVVPAGLANAAPLRVARTAVLPTPPAVCAGAADPSTPTVAADPAGREVVATALLRGGVAAAVMRSSDGGRRFAAAPVTGASACSGGAASHAFLANPRGALGADGTAFFASSWVGAQDGLFAYGVEAIAIGDAVTAVRPEPGSAQDVTVLPDRDGPGARALWTAYDQVPNPATYLPTGTRLRTAAIRPDGAVGPVTTALAPPTGTLLDDSSLVRADDGTLVAVASTGTYADLVTSLDPAGPPLRFTGVSARSADDGRTWQPGGGAGAPVLFGVERDGVSFRAVISDVAAGDGRVVRAWAEPPSAGRGRIVVTTSRDAGRTWSAPVTAVDVPVAAVTPAVAVLPGGRLALSWYDARDDVAGDGRLDLRPYAAVVGADGTSRDEVPLGPAFDMGPLVDPGYPVDATALGVTQDLVALPAGFGTVHTEPAGPGAGVTRVVYSRLSTTAAKRRLKRRLSGATAR